MYLFLKAIAVRKYLAHKLEEARQALLFFVKEQDHVIGRFESYKVFKDQCVMEDEVFSGEIPLQNVRESTPASFLTFTFQDRQCDLITDFK